MNTDLTDLVHESIARLTDGERIAGLAHRAARHNHHRRTALGMTAATSTAIIAAVAVLVTTVMADGFRAAKRRPGRPDDRLLSLPAPSAPWPLPLKETASRRSTRRVSASGSPWERTSCRACVTETKPQHRQSACPEDLNRGLAHRRSTCPTVGIP